MGLFFHEDPVPGSGRATGFARYREVLERDWRRFMAGGFLAIIGFIPFGVGMFYAIASTSFLVALAVGFIGGLFAGPGLYAFYDMIFRSLRDAPDPWWMSFRKALRKNWRSALLPGAVLGLLLSIFIFVGFLMFQWSDAGPSPGTFFLCLMSMILSVMLVTTFWPQLVLFEQSTSQRLKNCVLFCIKYFWHTLGVSVLQIAYWILMILLLPWSAFAAPFLNLWFILYLSNFLLYKDLDAAYQIQANIETHFPEQVRRQDNDLDFHIED